MSDKRLILCAVSRTEPVEVYLYNQEGDVVEPLQKVSEIHRRRIQLFDLQKGTRVTDSALVNVEGLIKLQSLGDIWLTGERWQILNRFLTMTEEMTPAAALIELKEAIDRIQVEILKCEEEIKQ